MQKEANVGYQKKDTQFRDEKALGHWSRRGDSKGKKILITEKKKSSAPSI